MPPAKSSHRPVSGLCAAILLTTLSVMMPKRPPATRRGCSGPAPSGSQLIAATTSGTPPAPGVIAPWYTLSYRFAMEAGDAIRAAARKAGCDDYLSKPIDDEALLKKIKKFLD